MKLFIITFVLFISLSVIYCQAEEEEAGVVQKSKDDNPVIPPLNGGRGLIDRVRDRISSGLGRLNDGFGQIRNRMQEHYQRHIERLQKKVVDSMERLQSYVNRKITETTEPKAKEYLEKLNENIGQVMESLRNMLTSVETRVSEAADRLPKVPKVPEYKLSGE